MAPKQKLAAEIGSLQQKRRKWRARAKGKEGREHAPLRDTKKEALVDLSKAREGATDATDVARGLAAVRGLAARQSKTSPKFAKVKENLSSGDAVAVPSSARQSAEPPHPSHGDAEAEASTPVPPSGSAEPMPSSASQSAEPPHPFHGDAEAEAASPRSRPRAKKLPRMNGFAAGRPRTEDDDELILLIRQPWLELILSGEKTWEMRSKPTKIRHRILLAEPGTGLCSGQAIISDCVKIERADFARHADKHQVRSPAGIAIIDNYQDIYAWQLQEVTRLSVQQPFKHPPGAVIWVRRNGAAAENARLREENARLREENAALRAQLTDIARDNWVDGVRCGKRGLCDAATPVTPGRAGRVAPPQDAK